MTQGYEDYQSSRPSSRSTALIVVSHADDDDSWARHGGGGYLAKGASGREMRPPRPPRSGRQSITGSRRHPRRVRSLIEALNGGRRSARSGCDSSAPRLAGPSIRTWKAAALCRDSLEGLRRAWSGRSRGSIRTIIPQRPDARPRAARPGFRMRVRLAGAERLAVWHEASHSARTPERRCHLRARPRAALAVMTHRFVARWGLGRGRLGLKT